MNELKLFLDHLRVSKNSSVHTLAAYERDLKQFEALLAKKKIPLMKAGENEIQAFLRDLKKKEQQASSVSRKISAIRQFYKFLIQENLIEEDPSLFIESPSRAKRLPKALPERTVEAILKTVDQGLQYQENPNSLLQIRDRAMIYFLYATGVRVSELIQIPLQNVDLEGGFARVMGKRKKERVVPFVPVVTRLLDEYLNKSRPGLLASLPDPESSPFFVGTGGKGLTRQGFWKVLKKIALASGIDGNLHPHLLRHTFATDLLKSGMDLRSLQMLLGHADLQTTQVYTHVAPDHLQEVIKKYHPRGGK